MICEHRTADQAGGTYGSSEAAAGWHRSGVARAQILAPSVNYVTHLDQFLELFKIRWAVHLRNVGLKVLVRP